MKKEARIFLPEEKSKQLDPVMREVKKQVKRYKAAKKIGKLLKSPSSPPLLFNL